ncbi:MAG: UPF0149 family protein [Woeseiaceae bacterium]|nr:UPF0149 family protein [Woeseiaceae bacterium]
MQIQHQIIDDALRRAGSGWDAAQSHGLVSGRLAVEGRQAAAGWLAQVLEGTDERNAARKECQDLLVSLFDDTHRQLTERQSGFAPLLPDDDDSTAARTEALAHWCEGFLHGLVSVKHDDALKTRLASEPLADIIKDVLQITRAAVSEDEDDDEDALIEIVEYLRVAAQLVYEELADLRSPEAP